MRWRGFLAVGAIAIWSTVVMAQDLGPVTVITDALWAQQFPDVAYGSAGDEYLVVWEQLDDSDAYDIYGRMVDGATGEPKGDPFPILADPGLDEQDPEVAYNPQDNQFLVICREPASIDVYAQLVADGKLVGDTVYIWKSAGPDWLHEMAARARVASLAYRPTDNQWLLGITPNESAAFAFLDSNGELIDVPVENLGRGTNPATAWSSTSDVGILAYEDRRGRDTGGENLSVFLIRPDWTSINEEPIMLRDQLNAEESPRIAYNSDDDQFLVIWDERLSWADDSGGARATDTYGQIVGTDGQLIGDPIPIEASTPYTLRQDVDYSPQGGLYLVVWKGDDSGSFAFADINGRFVARDGSMPGEKFLIYDDGDDDTDDGTNERYHDESKLPVVAVNSEGRFFVVWEEGGTNRNPEDRDILARFVTAPTAGVGAWSLFE